MYNSYQLNDNNATKRDPSRASSSVDNVVEMVAKGEPLDEAEEELLGNWSLEEKQILLRSLKT